jgi:hypothetical protein
MTNEEAVDELRYIAEAYVDEAFLSAQKALQVAISALEARGPVISAETMEHLNNPPPPTQALRDLMAKNYTPATPYEPSEAEARAVSLLLAKYVKAYSSPDDLARAALIAAYKARSAQS